MQNLDPDRNNICEPCLKGDHAWCYRHERRRWWVTCLCPKHDHRDDPDAALDSKEGER